MYNSKRLVARKHKREEAGMSVWTFHKAVVGGLAFEGLVSADGPYISCQARDQFSHGGVALVVSGLRRFTPTRSSGIRKPDGWWIVKYEDQERVFLRGFTESDIEAIGAEFGLVPTDSRECGGAAPFLRSRAWLGLVEWVAQRPRLARKAAGWDAYLPGWVDHAQAEAASRASSLAGSTA